MSNVSKLVIKACNDNKFCSFTGEFITSINPEDLVIKSAVSYNFVEGMVSSNFLKYRGSPPKLLSFSLLFDNTGIIPGSNTISVMEQIKQLQDVAYSIHTKNNAPNYIRIIWGQIDFKGRLTDLDIVYSMFQVDGTLIRAEASISVLEELVSLGKGKSLAGMDSEYAKPSGANATSKKMAASSKIPASQDAFAPTPDGMNGPYSGAPPGAYDGGPDQVYHGSNDAGTPVYASSSVGTTHSTSPVANEPTSSQTSYESSPSTGSTTHSTTAMNGSANQLQGGIAGNGPGGSGGGIGGGGHEPGSNTKKSGNNTASSGAAASGTSTEPNGSKHGAASSPAGSPKSNVAPGSAAAAAKGENGIAKASNNLAAGAAGAAAIASAAAIGANSLRDLTASAMALNFLNRVKNFVKKVAPRAYDAGKKAVK